MLASVAGDDFDDDVSEGVTERLSLDMPVDDVAFLKQWALFRNVLTRLRLAKGSKPSSQRVKAESRKSLGEKMLHQRILERKVKFAAMFEELGPFPSVSSSKVTKEEREAMSAYCRRVVTLEKKHNK